VLHLGDMSDSAHKHDATPRALFVTTVPITLRAFLLPLAEGLRAEGWCVDALTGAEDGTGGVRPGSEVSAAWQQAFDTIHTVPWSRSILSFAHYPQLARQVRTIVAEGGYHVVHVHTPIAALITRLALREVSGVRVIYTAHGFHFFRGQNERLRGWLFRRAEQYCARFTDVLVVMNDEDEAAARTLAAHAPRCEVQRIDGVGIKLGDYTAIPLTPEQEASLRKQYRLERASFVVGIIAEMNDNKRHRLALYAARVLKESHPRLRWLFIGTGPNERALRVRADAERLPVTFTGQLKRERLRELFSLIDLGLLVSEREGLPRSLMEFSAAGIPIAGTQSRGIIDEVRDERALATRARGGAIAEVIARIADDSTLAAELAAQQHRFAQEHFSLDVILPRYLALYKTSTSLPQNKNV